MERMFERGREGPIDFVISWVDGNDPAWQEKKARYQDPDADLRPQRYRDWELLRYWFRGVERFATYVRRVHFVTEGHLPSWLNTAHPKLHVARHEDFMPAEALPTFSSRAIEANLHRIPGLSERFVYFNDDMFLIRETKESDFFMDGLPRDMLALQPVVANPKNPVMSYAYLNTALAVSRHFVKRETMRKFPGKYFHPGYPLKYFVYNLLETLFPLYTGFYTVHGPSPFLKETFERVWEQEEALMRQTTLHRFRNGADVSQYLVREWAKQEGAFVPANLHRDFCYLDGSDCSKRNLDVIRRQKKKMICLNDSDHPFDFEVNKAAYQSAFHELFPCRSSFELPAREDGGKEGR